MMTDSDIDTVLSIESVCYPQPWKREHFKNEITARHSFPYVAEVHGSVVGYVCAMSLFEDAQILNIAVSPGLRGCGIAGVLLEYAIKVVSEHGAEVLALEVRSGNTAAIDLYDRFGFVRTGIRLKYYEGVDDAILMEKTLKEIT